MANNYFESNLPKEYATQDFDQYDMQNQQVNDEIANNLARIRASSCKTPIIFVSGNALPIEKENEMHNDTKPEENPIKDENTKTDSGIWNKNELAAKLMIRMGYEEGKGLGKDLQGISKPIIAHPRQGRGAIGAYGPENVPVTAKKPKSKKQRDLREVIQKKRKRSPYCKVEEYVSQNETETNLANNLNRGTYILNGCHAVPQAEFSQNFDEEITTISDTKSDDDVVILDSPDMFESLRTTQTSNSVRSENVVPPIEKLTKKQRRRERQKRREKNRQLKKAAKESMVAPMVAPVEAPKTIMSNEHISFCSCDSTDVGVRKSLMVEICKRNRDQMTKSEVDYITDYVCRALVTSKDAPKFEGTVIKNDAIQVQCANSTSLQWLSDVIAVAPDFNECKFTLKVNSKLQRLIRLKLWIPGKQRSARFIYDVLCAQNEGLDAKTWRTYFYGSVKDRPHESLLVFGVDLITFKLLRTKFDMKLYFHFWHLPVAMRGRVEDGIK